MPNLTVVDVPLAELRPYHKNPRRGNIPVIADSLRVNGQYKPIVVNAGTLTGRPNEILAGNHTYAAAVSLGWETIEATTVDVDDKGAARIVAADNRTSDLGTYDDEALAELLRELDGLEGTGYSEHDLLVLLSEPEGRPEVDRLADRFGAPPLSVLSARGGEWGERKRLWTGLGIRSELGRDGALVYDSPQTMYANWYDVKNAAEAEVGHKLTDAEVLASPGAKTLRGVGAGNGTSVFDPALTELIYAWYSAPGMRVIDPWAGGSVRGVVAAVLGREYTGIELRPEQIEANRLQLKVIGAAVRAGIGVGGEVPEWLGGEAGAVLSALPDESFDFAFSAPPKYSVPETIDDPEALTPVEVHDGVLVKRDDLFGLGSSRGGKVRSCLALAREAKESGCDTLVTAGSRQSPQVNIVAEVAAALGMKASVHVPSGALTPELHAAAEAGAEVHQHQYGRNSVIIARAKAEVEENPNAFEVPFGMETEKAIEWTALQVANIPDEVERIVVPVGSGMSLAGILTGLVDAGRSIPVLGVVVGSDPTKRLDKYAPAGWRDMVELVESPLDYHEAFRANRLGALVLDPIYEAKALPMLKYGDMLWVVGIRGTLADGGPVLQDATEPEWIEGESTEQLRELDAASYDLAFGCPPYYDLEKYSDDPRDLSNLSKAGFDEQMKRNIGELARVLRDDSYAVFVVGSVRDKKGYVLDMRRCMSEAAEAAGLRLVNDAVLLTPVGTAAPRAARGFKTTRTLTRVHQEVLVYVKGDRKRAAERCGEVEPLALAAVEMDEDDG